MAKTVRERAAVTFDNLICTGIVLVILVYLPVFFQMDFLNVFQESIEDFYVTDLIYYGGRDDVGKDTNIVLVNFAHLPRNKVAEQIKIINKYEPKVIGIDAFYRDEKKGRKRVVVPMGDTTYFNNPDFEVLAAEPQEDGTMKLVVEGNVVDPPLVKAFNETEQLVLACELINPLDSNKLFRWDTLLNSHEKFRKNAREGFVNMNTNQEEFLTVRHFSVKTLVHEDTIASFAVQIASLYDSIKTAKLFERGNQRELINYKRNLDKYKVLDWDEVFQKKDSLQFIKDKIVLMGFIGPDTNTIVTEDIFYSPMNDKIYGRAYPDMYGVVVHANIISMILDGDYINSMLGWPSWILSDYERDISVDKYDDIKLCQDT